MREIKNRQFHNKKGFTLAETLIALALSIILLGMGLFAVIHYSKNMKITEMDMTAKQIFTVAQNHLTSAKVTGALNKYKENGGNLGTAMPTVPKDFPADMKWPQRTNDEFYYIAYSPNNPNTKESSMLKYMLPFGAIDETVRSDGYYIIEYSVKTASVYSVFYTDNQNGVEYMDVLSLDASGGRADTDLGWAERRNYTKNNKSLAIGYYGGAMIENIDAGDAGESFTMKVENGERLLVKVIDENYFDRVDVGDGTLIQLKNTVRLTVKGQLSGEESAFILKLDGDNLNPVKKDPTKDKWWTVEKVRTDGELTDKLEYTIVLDDLTTPGGHFTDIFPKMIPGENVTIKATSTGESVSTPIQSARGSTNSLFGNASMSKDYSDDAATGNRAFDVEAAFIRHVENLDTKISKLPQDKSKILVKNVTQSKDMNWNTYYKDLNKPIYAPAINGSSAILARQSYYPITNPYLESYSGNNKTMSNFVITSETDGAGLFKEIGYQDSNDINMVINNLTLENFTVESRGTDNAYDRTIGSAGALAAHISGNVMIRGVMAINGKVTSIHSAAGGLIGDSNKAVFHIINSVAGMNVKAGKYAGGLFGAAKSSRGEIYNTYTSGHTNQGTYPTGNYDVEGGSYTGGFIGYLDAYGPNDMLGTPIDITKCYSTASAYGVEYVGGFTGRDNHKVTYTDCYATGLVGAQSTVTKQGGFAGYMTYAGPIAPPITSPEICKALDGINGNMKPVGAGSTDGAVMITYEQLKMESTLNRETYSFDPFLSGETYPFPTVNTTGAKNVESTGVHYGDWPMPGETHMAPTEIMFAYREGMWNIPGAQWYIKGVDQDGKLGVVYNTFPVGYVENKQKRPEGSDAEYGLLLPRTSWSPKDFSGGSVKNYFGENYSGYIQINGKEYYFFPLLSTMDPRTGTSPKDTVIYRAAYSKQIQVLFSFTPGYAATIGATITNN